MKKTIAAVFALFAFSLFADAPKYVILFIGDGMSVPQRMIADEFSRKTGSGPLAMNSFPYVATTRTASSDSLVTDSAAAATAIACGVKTRNHYSGVDPDGKPVYSCAKAAKEAGKKVGICSTVTITHATPAGFYAHRNNRGDAYGIALDLVASDFDFFAGGGLDINEGAMKSHPQYKEFGDAYENAWKHGYRKVKTREEFLALAPGCGKILTKFTNGPLSNAIDAKTSEPTLAEITAKAIEILDGDAGFFLMVEGGRIDWAGHSNDAATNLRDVLALDEAVKVALGFAERHADETLVVVTGDHETGGMSMGFADTGYALYMDRLANQTCSVDVFASKVDAAFRANPKLDFEGVKPILRESFGFRFPGDSDGGAMTLSSRELRELRTAFDHDVEFHRHQVGENPAYDGEKRYLFGGAARLVMAHKCGIGWSSGAHTAMPVLTTAKGCGAENFTGFIENTDIAKILKSFYGK